MRQEKVALTFALDLSCLPLPLPLFPAVLGLSARMIMKSWSTSETLRTQS